VGPIFRFGGYRHLLAKRRYGRIVGDRDYEAAWVPHDDADNEPELALQLAIGWFMARARDLGVQPLLVLPEARTVSHGPDQIRQLAKRCEWTTPRSKGGQVGSAVLAYAPDYKGMALAGQRATGAVLAVVPWPPLALNGWAVERRALDLVTGETTPDDRSDELIGFLDSLDRNGNNGWGSAYDKRDVPRILAAMREQDLLDPDVVLGCMLARGHDATSIETLAGFLRRA
jgi:hypothetical protein